MAAYVASSSKAAARASAPPSASGCAAATARPTIARSFDAVGESAAAMPSARASSLRSLKDSPGSSLGPSARARSASCRAEDQP